MTATYDSIATVALSSDASSINFNSIPTTFTDLRLVLVGTGSTFGTAPRLTFNSDTGTNYSYTGLFNSNTAVMSSRGTNNSFIDLAIYRNFQPNNLNARFLDIFNYAGSTNKTVLSTETGDDSNQDLYSTSLVYLWRNTSAISSIQITLPSTNFTTGTVASLYGIKAE